MAALLKEKPDRVRLRNRQGLYPLHVAAREGHAAAVRALIAAGADVNATDDRPAGEYRPASTNGWTPLHLAALSGRAKAAAVLLDHRADVNAADQRGKHTPLHLAAWAGDADLVRLLLARKADPGAKDAMDRTPLDLATERGHGGVISLLKECGLRRGPVSGRGHYVRSTRSPSPAMSPSWVV